MLKDLLNFLTDKDGRSYKVENAIVTTSGTPTPLSNDPDGWNDTSVKYARNLRYYGLFRSFTTPLKFVADGARIIRDQMYKFGSEAELFLIIMLLDKSFNGGWIYRPFYRGEIDGSKTLDEEFTVSANIMEGGLDKLLKANENTKYTLDLDDIEVRMDGLDLQHSGQFIVLNGIEPYGNHSVAVDLVSQEGIETGIKSTDRINIADNIAVWNDQYARMAESEQWFYAPSNTAPLKIEWDFNLRTYLSPGTNEVFFTNTVLSFEVWILGPNGELGSRVVLQHFDGFNNVMRTNHFVGAAEIDFNIPNVTDYKAYLFIGVDTISDVINQPDDQNVYHEYLIDFDNVEGSMFKIVGATYKHPLTLVKAITPMSLGQKLLDKITGGGYTFSSTLLSTSGLLVTSGDAIRGINGAKITTSWNEFFDSYNVPCNLEAHIKENTVYIETKETAFQSNVLEHIGKASEVKIKPYEDLLFSGVKVGYPDVSSDDVNGKEEFNVTQHWTGPITRTTKVLELVSTYKASMYDIESIRINLEGKNTTDADSDNNVYFLNCSYSTQYNQYVLRRRHSSIENCAAGMSAFNVELSPKHCLMVHGNFLRSCYFFQPDGALKMQSTQRNADIIVTYQGTGYTTIFKEKDDLKFSDQPPAYFIPMEVEIRAPVSVNLMQVMADSPQGLFSFIWEENLYFGYPLEVGVKPTDRPVQESRLLFSANNDILKLIR